MEPDIEHLRQWIGRSQHDEEMLTPALVRRFNATFDRESGSQNGDVAPLLIHLCLTQPITASAGLGPDGHPKRGGFLPPVPLPRRMWAGGAFTFHGDIRIGSVVRRVSTIRDVQLKQGRTGPLCFVTVEHKITSDDRPALTERQDLVYRDLTTATHISDPAPGGDHTRQIAPSALLLFRYSALTFNGHRIHYDRPYATGVEGYPGLMVHGPMQATMLCQMAADLRNKPPRAFRFRSLSPIFDNMEFTANAKSEGDGLKLWTARAGGPVAMEAFADW